MASSSAKRSPDDAALARLLGPTKARWDGLLERAGGLTPAWKFYGEKYGWQLKLLRGKKALLYLVPRDGRFTASFPLTEAAFQALRASDLPAGFIREVEGAKQYPEGRPARVEVTSAASAALARRLLALVLAS